MLDVYIADIRSLEQESVFYELMEQVSKNRKEKVLSCRNMKDRCRSLAAGLLLREGLQKLGISEQEAPLIHNPHGKLMLPEELGIYFNLSHGGNYAVCAVSSESVGVDLENSTERFVRDQGQRRFMALVKRALTKEEQELLKGLSWQEQISLFTRIWTKKESYAKEDGRGMLIPFSQIDTIREVYSVDTEIQEGYWLSVYKKNPEGAQISQVDFLNGKKTG